MEVKQTHITIEKDKIEEVIQWAEKHGEIVFAGGGMDAVDSMNVFVESLRRSVAKAEKQEPVAWRLNGTSALGHGKVQGDWKVGEPPTDVIELVKKDAYWSLEFAYTHPQPKREPLTDEPEYYLQDTRGYVGNCPLWWAQNGNGYTTDLRKAHRYTLAEAMSQHRCRESDLPWSCEEIDPLQRPTIDVQDMHKIRDIKEQRALLQAAHGIKENT